MAMTSFSRIIEEVRQRPELWSKSHDGFRNRGLHKKTWRMIAHKLQSDETLVKKRWKHLKDQYRKELKKHPGKIENEDHCNYWMYFKPMEFIKNELLNVKGDAASQSSKRSHQSESEEDEADQSEFDGPLPPTATAVSPPAETTDNERSNYYVHKRLLKMTGMIERHIKACEADARKDPDYMFLMSIMPSIQKLSEIQKFVFRGKINDWLLEAMTQNEYNEQCDTDSKYFLQTQLEVECQEGGEITTMSS